MRESLTKFCCHIEVWPVQKHVNLVDLVKSFPTNIYLQNLASIQKRTSPVKFALLAEKSEKGSISNLSTKVPRSRRCRSTSSWACCAPSLRTPTSLSSSRTCGTCRRTRRCARSCWPGRGRASAVWSAGMMARMIPARSSSPVASPLVERFDRRGIEPFELFTSEFGQRCVRIQEI